MYLKVEKSGFASWSLNGSLISVSLDGSQYFHKWLKENTNAYNGRAVVRKGDEERVIEYFMRAGFTPVYECFGSKIIDGTGGKPKYELSDDVRWFLFDGIAKSYWYSSKIYSIAVAWNKNDDVFTVYNNQYNDKKRIGIYDDWHYVFELVNGYLPVKIIDRSAHKFVIDWNKLHNHIACPNISTDLGEIRSADVDWSIFEKRLGNIINHVLENIEYFTEDKDDNPYGYSRKDLMKHLFCEKSDDGKVDIVRFYFKRMKNAEIESGKDSWIEFSFENEDYLRISMYDGMTTASPTCVESIRVQRGVTQVNTYNTLLLFGRKSGIATKTMSAYGNSVSREEEALAYLPHLGVYTIEDIMGDKNDDACV